VLVQDSRENDSIPKPYALASNWGMEDCMPGYKVLVTPDSAEAIAVAQKAGEGIAYLNITVSLRVITHTRVSIFGDVHSGASCVFCAVGAQGSALKCQLCMCMSCTQMPAGCLARSVLMTYVCHALCRQCHAHQSPLLRIQMPAVHARSVLIFMMNVCVRPCPQAVVNLACQGVRSSFPDMIQFNLYTNPLAQLMQCNEEHSSFYDPDLVAFIDAANTSSFANACSDAW
jgi:hypothetical protein